MTQYDFCIFGLLSWFNSCASWQISILLQDYFHVRKHPESSNLKIAAKEISSGGPRNPPPPHTGLAAPPLPNGRTDLGPKAMRTAQLEAWLIGASVTSTMAENRSSIVYRAARSKSSNSSGREVIFHNSSALALPAMKLRPISSRAQLYVLPQWRQAYQN